MSNAVLMLFMAPDGHLMKITAPIIGDREYDTYLTHVVTVDDKTARLSPIKKEQRSTVSDMFISAHIMWIKMFQH